MKWRHLDAVAPSMERGDLTPEDLATIEDVLDAAQAFADGEMPFYEAARFGTLTAALGDVEPRR